MNELFADTSFFVSFLNPRDTHHARAAEYMEDFTGPIVTTVLILVELGNYLSGSGNRRLFIPFTRELHSDKRFEVLPPEQWLIDGGMLQYERSPDKKWSFTDCTSFVTMRRRKMTEALTADRHFEQAGFAVLLK